MEWARVFGRVEIVLPVLTPPPKCKQRDLLRVFDTTNAKFFGGLVCGGIGWRKLPTNAPNFALALCVIEERFIKIGTILSDARIPDWYFNFVVFHEMLHLHVGRPVNLDGSHADPHSGMFDSLEKRHPDYQRSLVFEDKKLPAIMASWIKWSKSQRKAK